MQSAIELLKQKYGTKRVFRIGKKGVVDEAFYMSDAVEGYEKIVEVINGNVVSTKSHGGPIGVLKLREIEFTGDWGAVVMEGFRKKNERSRRRYTIYYYTAN